MRRLQLILLAATALGHGSAAHAENTFRMVGDAYLIDRADLDLDSNADRQELVRRIEWASRRVCRNNIVRVVRTECIRAAREQATAAAGLVSPIAITAAVKAGRPQ